LASATPIPFDWSMLGTLRLRARAIADGVYAGMHASTRKGSGVEFGGHRPYVPGDDLRFLDLRAMMRHDRLIIRELQTETDRALRLIVDGSASMGFQSRTAPVSKLAFAAALASALARVAVSSGDPVALDFLGGDGARSLPALAGREAFERIVSLLESTRAAGDLREDEAALDRAFAASLRHARRGTVLVFFSDLIDVHEGALGRFAALGTNGRTLLTVRVLDPEEATLPYEGAVRLVSVEGTFQVATDASAVRAAYLRELGATEDRWKSRLRGRGGDVLRVLTSDDPIDAVRRILRAVAQAGAGR
jgi:uncharacterized protein (DUF58 family)